MPRTAAAKTATSPEKSPEDETPNAEAPAKDVPKKSADSKSDTEATGPCPECFPLGWPEGVEAAGCEHGSWTRGSET
ncbi:MAG: hypothetical protein HOY79_20645 [Streptomyces sp.]|nr:hypothetical protein [Streptomyces sp.]